MNLPCLRFMKLFYWQKNNARKYTCRTPFCLVWNIVIINDNAKLPNIKKRNLPSILRCPYPFHKIRLHNLSLEVAPCMCHLIKLVPVYGMLHSHCEEQYLDKQIKNMLKTNLYDKMRVARFDIFHTLKKNINEINIVFFYIFWYSVDKKAKSYCVLFLLIYIYLWRNRSCCLKE